MGLFLFVTVSRVFIYSEFKLIMCGCPIHFGCGRLRRKTPETDSGLPVVLAVFVVLFFAINEYFRSWTNFYIDCWDAYWSFALNRLAAYYLTAVNNGAGAFENYDTVYMPLDTADWFWRFPIEIVPGGMPTLFNVKHAYPLRIFGGIRES